MNTLAAIVNLLTLIANVITASLRRRDYTEKTQDQRSDVEKLNENPARFIADMFGTRGSDGVRSDEQANKDLYYTDKADPPR